MCCSAGVDLISDVSCDAPYEWLDKTDSEWDFKKKQSSESFHVSITWAVRDINVKPCTEQFF